MCFRDSIYLCPRVTGNGSLKCCLKFSIGHILGIAARLLVSSGISEVLIDYTFLSENVSKRFWAKGSQNAFALWLRAEPIRTYWPNVSRRKRLLCTFKTTTKRFWAKMFPNVSERKRLLCDCEQSRSVRIDQTFLGENVCSVIASTHYFECRSLAQALPDQLRRKSEQEKINVTLPLPPSLLGSSR